MHRKIMDPNEQDRYVDWENQYHKHQNGVSVVVKAKVCSRMLSRHQHLPFRLKSCKPILPYLGRASAPECTLLVVLYTQPQRQTDRE